MVKQHLRFLHSGCIWYESNLSTLYCLISSKRISSAAPYKTFFFSFSSLRLRLAHSSYNTVKKETESVEQFSVRLEMHDTRYPASRGRQKTNISTSEARTASSAWGNSPVISHPPRPSSARWTTVHWLRLAVSHLRCVTQAGVCSQAKFRWQQKSEQCFTWTLRDLKASSSDARVCSDRLSCA